MLPINCNLYLVSKTFKKGLEACVLRHLQLACRRRYTTVHTRRDESHEPSTPLECYVSLVKSGELREDPCQKKIVEELQNVFFEIQGYSPPKPTFFTKFIKKPIQTESPNGIYLHGAVGGGKTMLMDLFYDCCKVC